MVSWGENWWGINQESVLFKSSRGGARLLAILLKADFQLNIKNRINERFQFNYMRQWGDDLKEIVYSKPDFNRHISFKVDKMTVYFQTFFFTLKMDVGCEGASTLEWALVLCIGQTFHFFTSNGDISKWVDRI